MSRDIEDIYIIDRIINSFFEADFDTEGQRLASFKQDLLSEKKELRIKAAQNIIGYCHPKVWGDLSVYGKCGAYNTLQEWDTALAQLRKSARNIMNQ